MREIKKTNLRIVISNMNQNQMLEIFISMKWSAECKETAHAIIFD